MKDIVILWYEVSTSKQTLTFKFQTLRETRVFVLPLYNNLVEFNEM
jgi:hypothetical protein